MISRFPEAFFQGFREGNPPSFSNGKKMEAQTWLENRWQTFQILTEAVELYILLPFIEALLQDIRFLGKDIDGSLHSGSACAFSPASYSSSLGWWMVFIDKLPNIEDPTQSSNAIHYKEIFPSLDLIPKDSTQTSVPRLRFRSAMNVGEWASSWLCIRRHLKGPKGAIRSGGGMGWRGWYTVVVVVVVRFFEWTLKRWLKNQV